MHAEKTPVRFRHPLQIMGTVPTSVGASCAFLLRIVSTRTDVVDEAICRGLVVGTPTLPLEQEQHCIAALHKERFPNDQKPIIMHIVDAHIAVFLPVPLQQLFPSGGSYLQNSWAAVFRRPFFLFRRFWLREGG